jgi:hypothetical protein
MQWSLSLNNFDVHPSASNTGDGVSEVVLSLHQRGKKTKPNKTTQNKKKKHHKVSQVQMQYSFSKFFSMQV